MYLICWVHCSFTSKISNSKAVKTLFWHSFLKTHNTSIPCPIPQMKYVNTKPLCAWLQEKDTHIWDYVHMLVYIIIYICKRRNQDLVGFQILPVQIKIGLSPRRKQNCNLQWWGFKSGWYKSQSWFLPGEIPILIIIEIDSNFINKIKTWLVEISAREEKGEIGRTWIQGLWFGSVKPVSQLFLAIMLS